MAGLEAALRRQDSAVEKLQAGAKRHMEASLRQGTTRKSLQQATQKEDKLRQQVTRLEAELTATRRSAHDTPPFFPPPHRPAPTFPPLLFQPPPSFCLTTIGLNQREAEFDRELLLVYG